MKRFLVKYLILFRSTNKYNPDALAIGRNAVLPLISIPLTGQWVAHLSLRLVGEVGVARQDDGDSQSRVLILIGVDFFG
ncbi:hypothetical protein L0128_11025 [candidate division KSB1 bacterium]|nr:hypothetical protein [candidate division KSB1 bacterium]